MARRSKDWNEGLSRDLQDPEFAREFLLASLNEGISIQQGLSKVIRAMGVKEYSRKAKMAPSNVVRAIGLKHNPTQETLNRLLRPLGLTLTVAPLRKSGKRAA